MFRKFSNKKDTGCEINNSLIFGSSSYLSKTWSASPTNSKKYTVSFWIKRAEIDLYQYIFSACPFGGTGQDELAFANTQYGDPLGSIKMAYGMGVTGLETTKAGYTDCSSWYHVCYYFDSTIPKESVFINGVLQDEITTYTPIAQNLDTFITQNGYTLTIGGRMASGIVSERTIRGAISEFHLIDGQALGPEQFALEDSKGVYNPIPYTGTYGTNGFYLPFEASDIGADESGNDNDFTPSGLTSDSVVADGPCNNYCTFNPLSNGGNYGSWAYSDGNLKLGPSAKVSSTITYPMPKSGKWYFEYELLATDTPDYGILLGFIDSAASMVEMYPPGYICGTTVENDCRELGLYGLAIDMDSMSQTLYFNGSLKDTMSGTSAGIENLTLALLNSNTSFTRTFQFNFGQRSWAYEPPSGYKALCTKNLPDTLVNPKENFSVNTWSGNTQSDPIVTGFQPGLVWVKRRDTTYDHYLVDTVRGRTRALSSNDTGVEEAKASGIVSWDGNGFATGPDVGFSGDSMVGWTLKAGNTVTNNDGSIPSQVSANRDMGFSVVSYTGDLVNGATIGHGLGKPPSLVILKSLNVDYWWPVGSDVLGSSWDHQLYLNESNQSQPTTYFNSTPPTSSVVTLGAHPDVNNAGDDYIAYCFTNTEMLQVGSYVGNGLDDGTFVSLPFKPAYFMCKLISGEIANWAIYDNARNTYNSVDAELYADVPTIEAKIAKLDFLSNGVKYRSGRTVDNKNGGNYLYLAISEQPFKHARGR